MSLQATLNEIANIIAEEAAKNPAFKARLEGALEQNATPSPVATDGPATASDRESVPKEADLSPGTGAARSANPLGRRVDGAAEAGVKRRGGRRTPAVLDPIELAAQGEGALRERLSDLDLELLLDIVAQYGMDPGKLVMKWRDQDRVIDRIVELSLARATKGDAFRKE